MSQRWDISSMNKLFRGYFTHPISVQNLTGRVTIRKGSFIEIHPTEGSAITISGTESLIVDTRGTNCSTQNYGGLLLIEHHEVSQINGLCVTRCLSKNHGQSIRWSSVGSASQRAQGAMITTVMCPFKTADNFGENMSPLNTHLDLNDVNSTKGTNQRNGFYCTLTGEFTRVTITDSYDSSVYLTGTLNTAKFFNLVNNDGTADKFKIVSPDNARSTIHLENFVTKENKGSLFGIVANPSLADISIKASFFAENIDNSLWAVYFVRCQQNFLTATNAFELLPNEKCEIRVPTQKFTLKKKDPLKRIMCLLMTAIL